MPYPKKKIACVNDRVILVCVSKKRHIIRKKWGYNKNITVTRAIVYALRSTCCTPRDYLIKCGHIFCAPSPPHYNLCLVTYQHFFLSLCLCVIVMHSTRSSNVSCVWCVFMRKIALVIPFHTVRIAAPHNNYDAFFVLYMYKIYKC